MKIMGLNHHYFVWESMFKFVSIVTLIILGGACVLHMSYFILYNTIKG